MGHDHNAFPFGCPSGAAPDDADDTEIVVEQWLDNLGDDDGGLFDAGPEFWLRRAAI